jgi:hypothetical protein
MDDFLLLVVVMTTCNNDGANEQVTSNEATESRRIETSAGEVELTEVPKEWWF